MSSDAFRIVDDRTVWRVRLDAPPGFQAAGHSNDFRLFLFPSGAVLSWALKLEDAANEALLVHHAFDLSDGTSKAWLDQVTRTGRLLLAAEGEGGFEKEVSVGSAKLGRLVKQGLAHNGRLSALNGAEAVGAFLEAFTPVFRESGVEAGWDAAERRIGLFSASKPAIGPSSSSGSSAEIGASQTARGRKPAAAESEKETGIHGADFAPLLEAAHPALYRQNAFRIAEISVRAQNRDLDRRQRLIDMAGQTGAAVPPGPARALPLNGSVDAEALRDAMSRLRDPVRRLLDEIFWFWLPVDGAADPALAPLAEGRVRPAFEAWKAEGLRGDPEAVASHNVAVLCHAAALDLEDPAAAPGLKDATPREAAGYWDLAYKAWKLVLDADAFWTRVERRIEEIGDPRLPAAAARRIRRTLPLALLAINARLAVQAVERNDADAAARHGAVLERSGLDPALVDRALRDACGPLRSRLDVLCAEAEEAYREDAEKGDEACLSLLEKAAPLLAGVDRLFPRGSAAREAAHDAVASRARQAVIAFGNATSITPKVVGLLERVLEVAEGEAARQTFQEDVATARRLIEEEKQNAIFLKCWFCKTGETDVPSSALVEMHGNVTREYALGGTRVKWQTNTLKVPRCARCKAVHDRTDAVAGKFGATGAVLAIVGVLVLFFMSKGEKDFGAFFGLGCGGLIATGIAAAVFAGIGNLIGRLTSPSGVKGESYKTSFPTILEAQKEGWAIGAKPPGVQ